jgi:ABC-type Fe3+/spermidine/putrescine transport system ATPase subunit
MHGGRIEQIGTPTEVYHRPRSRFVASFIGASNILEGRMCEAGIEIDGETWPAHLPESLRPGVSVTALVRPEHFGLVGASEVAGLTACVDSITFLGGTVRLSVKLRSGRTIICDQPSIYGGGLSRGEIIRLLPDPARVVVVDDMAA